MSSGDDTLRRRGVKGVKDISATPNKEETHPHVAGVAAEKDSKGQLTNSFWLTRVVFLRCLAAIYFVAFLIAFDQNKELIGDRGLLPFKLHLAKIKSHLGGEGVGLLDRFLAAPTVFWLFEPWEKVDPLLDYVALTGMALSSVVVVTGAANAPALMILWLLYHSLVNVGQTWYSFGWESQLLETGFLAIWLVPVMRWSSLPQSCPTPWIGPVLYRWLLMRIMLGAGLIKMRGDRCWRNLTCMNVFFETQPNPNPMAYYAHFAPEAWHKFETFGNHVVELVLPFLTLLPFRWPAMINGSFQILFQAVLISTGNLSFLNWLTILPALWFFDDTAWSCLFSRDTIRQAITYKANNTSASPSYYKVRSLVNFAVAGTICYLSVPIVANLVSPRQVMNTSFEPFRLVNTYGAFGSVTKVRTEVVFEGTASSDPERGEWLEYEFKCKPGNVTKRPCLISPYHYRLDWLMWFAAFQDYQSNPWLLHLAGKMLDNDPLVDSLLASNPFRNGAAPKFVRAVHYRYSYAKLGTREKWWTRKKIKDYLPIVEKQMLKPVYDQLGWTF